MRIDILSKMYDEFVLLSKKYNLDNNDIVDFILSFILLNMRDGLDDEDARIFCHRLYKSMLREIELRKRD